MKALLHLEWMLPLWDGPQSRQFLQFFLWTVLMPLRQVSGPPVSPLSNPSSVMTGSDARMTLLKQKPNYVTSLLELLQWFPMEAVLFKVIFLAAKPFLQTKV